MITLIDANVQYVPTTPVFAGTEGDDLHDEIDAGDQDSQNLDIYALAVQMLDMMWSRR